MSKRKTKYYSLDRILKKQATYNLIVGERSNGKTYSVLKYSLEQYFENGGTLAIIRRWQEDIKGKRASDIFNALLENGEVEKISKGEYTGITYYAGKFYLCNYDENTGKAIYNNNDVFAYCFALSDTEHNKSISYPTVRTIMFDEFLTRRLYLPDEFILFMNTLSTIIRLRTDVKIFMLGNTVNKFSPYFQEMGLTHVDKMKQGTIDMYRYGDTKLTVAVEYCSSIKNEKTNNFYFAFDNPKLNMITTGAWELDIYPHLPIKYKPNNILFTYFIEFMDKIFQCEIIDVDGNMFTFIHNKTTEIKDSKKDLIYSLEYNHLMNYNRNIYRPTTKIGERVKWFFQVDKVFYQDNTVGDSINNYLNLCRGVY